MIGLVWARRETLADLTPRERLVIEQFLRDYPGSDPSLWLRMQNNYDLARTKEPTIKRKLAG